MEIWILEPEIRRLLENGLEAIPHDLVVIDDEEVDHERIEILVPPD